MNLNLISKEMFSPGLKEIVISLAEVVERVRTHDITHQQASAETAAHKHMIQGIALDWLYNRKSATIAIAKDRLAAIENNSLKVE